MGDRVGFARSADMTDGLGVAVNELVVKQEAKQAKAATKQPSPVQHKPRQTKHHLDAEKAESTKKSQEHVEHEEAAHTKQHFPKVILPGSNHRSKAHHKRHERK